MEGREVHLWGDYITLDERDRALEEGGSLREMGNPKSRKSSFLYPTEKVQ